MLDSFSGQMEQIMQSFNQFDEQRNERGMPSQIMLFASTWTPSMDAFMKSHMPTPMVAIGSKNEAAIYGGLKLVSTLCCKMWRCTHTRI